MPPFMTNDPSLQPRPIMVVRLPAFSAGIRALECDGDDWGFQSNDHRENPIDVISYRCCVHRSLVHVLGQKVKYPSRRSRSHRSN